MLPLQWGTWVGSPATTYTPDGEVKASVPSLPCSILPGISSTAAFCWSPLPGRQPLGWGPGKRSQVYWPSMENSHIIGYTNGAWGLLPPVLSPCHIFLILFPAQTGPGQKQMSTLLFYWHSSPLLQHRQRGRAHGGQGSLSTNIALPSQQQLHPKRTAWSSPCISGVGDRGCNCSKAISDASLVTPGSLHVGKWCSGPSVYWLCLKYGLCQQFQGNRKSYTQLLTFKQT